MISGGTGILDEGGAVVHGVFLHVEEAAAIGDIR